MAPALSPDAKDERRQRILDAALEVFFDKGFAAARMDDVAERAGMSKGALYLYFSSKEALFEALIDTVATPIVEGLEAGVGAAPSAKAAIEMLISMAPVILEQSPLIKFLKIMVGDARAFPQIAAAYRERVAERGLALLEGVLRRGQQTGELKLEDPALTARLVIAPVVLSAVWRIVFEADGVRRLDVEALLRRHGEMLARALAPEDRS